MSESAHEVTSTGKDRVGALDSIRGLASLAVLLGHSLAVCEWNCWFTDMPVMNNAIDGRSAVTMFFVLSGFVLSLRFFQNAKRKLELMPFYARRFTRIWIPWFAFFLVSLGVLVVRPPVPPTDPVLTEHQLGFWSSRNTMEDLALQLVFQLHDATKMLLPQDWSLGVELRASLFVPLLIFLCRYHWGFAFGLGVTIWLAKPSGGYYYASFAVGTVTAFAHARLSRESNSKWLPWFMLGGGAILYQVRWLFEQALVLPEALAEKEVWMISSIGCALVILGTLCVERVKSLLEGRIPTYLGRISYSLYLVQVMVLVCLGPWVVRWLNLAGMGAESPLLAPLFVVSMVAVCLPLAALGERFIEIPSIWLGRKATSLLQRTRIGRFGI